MNAAGPVLPDHLVIADSWSVSVTDRLERSRRTAWLVAAGFAALALLLAIALVFLLPLRTVEPYTLLVDRQTGHVEALAPLERQTIAPDTALTRSFLVQYVIARESFDIDSLQNDYRKVALWSQGEARERYIASMQPNNAASPLAYLPRRAVVAVSIFSVSSLSPTSSLVRFVTTRRDPAGQAQDPQHWAAVVSYRFSGAEMSADDRLLNPLGFQVTRYRRDAEAIPVPAAVPPAQQGPVLPPAEGRAIVR